MIGVPVSPRRVFGVSFRAGPEGGARTWVCRAHPGADGLRVESVVSFDQLPGGCAGGEPAMRALVGKILDAPASAWGMDFAFGQARRGGPEEGAAHDPAPWHAAWRAEVEARASVPAATAPPELATVADPGRRRTDRDNELESPLAPDRVAATLAGARGILLPLLASPQVAVLPMTPLPLLPPGTPAAMQSRAASTYVLEVEPRALLRRLGVEIGRELVALASDAAGRRELLRVLVELKASRPLSRPVRESICEQTRAMDALLCAVAAWRGYRGHAHGKLCRDPHYGAEGFVYC